MPTGTSISPAARIRGFTYAIRNIVAEARRVPDALHLAAVGQPGARAEIRRHAAGLGLRDGHDLIAVA